ncbi:MAG: hypothetical protein KA586_05880 [Candidatus Promineofilum sp.]|nr:hypothetical protein [Promineifilum sp.]
MKHLSGRDGFRAARLRPAVLLLFGFVLLLQASAASALNWNIQTVDDTAVVGSYTSLALDAAGNPHISYFDNTYRDLKYATWNGTSWDLQTVDSGGIVGPFTSLALDADGNPHISYFDNTNFALKYAAWNGTSWDLETVDSAEAVGEYTSLALDAAGNPRISYYDFTNSALKYAAWNGTSWSLSTVDSDGDVGYVTSLALDAAGNPRISYLDNTNGDLKYASLNGTSWDLQTVDSDGVVGWFTSLALDAAGDPHISYFNDTNDALKYAARNGTSWDVSTVDSDGDVGAYTSLALDAAGNPRISYYDVGNRDLKYAAWNGTDWDRTTVDSYEDVGPYTSLALDAAGNPRISYYNDLSGDLKYADGLPAAKLTITKSVGGSGAPADWSFAFSGDLGAFNLTDEGPSTTEGSVTPGTVAVNETNPAGYATSASCDNGATSTDGTLSVTLADGDDVTCTFTNTICQLGSFDTTSTWACAAAAPGHFVDTIGASAQTACDPGYYQPASGATACFSADPGYYATGPAAIEQTACPAGMTSPPGSDSIDDCVNLAPDIFMSAKTAGTTGDGLAFGPEDILKWDGSAWSTWFDGSAALLMPNRATHNINAFWIPDPDGAEVVMSFAQNRRFVPDITVPVDGMDLVRWDGGEFSFYFDGSDVALTQKVPEKIDGLHVLPGSQSPINGGNCEAYLLISTLGSGRVPNYGGGTLKFSGEDVLGFCATQLGINTTGYWHMVVDGSAAGLPKNATDSISLDEDGRTLYLTTKKAVNLGGGVVGGHSMVFAYDLVDGTFSGPHFSAPANGLKQQVAGLQVDGSLP